MSAISVQHEVQHTPTNNKAAEHEIHAPPAMENDKIPTRTTSSTSTSAKTSMKSHPDTNLEISHIYLDFTTPIATTPFFPVYPPPSYPPCPNLTPYSDPLTWSPTRKNLMTYVSCATNMAAAYSAGAYASPASQLTQLWGISHVTYNVGITTFTIGFGLAPMVLAPFSEINGRRPVFIATGVLFVAMQLACALTGSYAGMLVARLFAGIGGSTFSTMVGGILADIWGAEERNTAMVLFTGATMFGTGLGPLVSGFVAERLVWRWVFYVQVITSGVLVGLVTVFFKETRGPILLERKARVLNAWVEELEGLGAVGMYLPGSQAVEMATSTYTSTLDSPLDEKGTHQPSLRRDNSDIHRPRYRVLTTENRLSIPAMLTLSLTRPATLLFTEPILILFSLWISFSWAILYLLFPAIPLVFSTVHGFTPSETGAVFTSVCVGGLLSTLIKIPQDKWARRRFGTRFTGQPEGRLWFTCAEGLLLPIGLFWFGGTCTPTTHWLVPCAAISAVTMGIFSIFLATFNYTADVYRGYASSALAASGVCRNLAGGILPLVTVRMFEGLGFKGASWVLGGWRGGWRRGRGG